tara:strand:- start:144 stop:572 length:429 start_codon:yes stop_codon:yes gene_type:complete
MTSTNPKKKTKQAIPGLPKIDKRVVSIEGDQKLSQASIQSLLQQHHAMREQIKAFDEEVKKPYENLSKQIANYMVNTNMQAKEKLDCIENGYAVQLKARAKWTYSLETKRMALDLKTEQQLEQDTGVATNDPTFYISPVDPE